MPPSAVPAKLVLFQDNTQQIGIFGLQNITTGAFVSDATLTATLLDRDRNQVPNCIAIPLTYSAGSNGNYFGVITAAFDPALGTEFTMVIDGDEGGGHLHIEIVTEVQVRTS